MQPERYIGIMTGTSMDGVDFALVTFDVDNSPAAPPILETLSHTFPFPEELKEPLHHLLNHSVPISHVADLHMAYAYAIANLCQQFCECYQVEPYSITAIGLHGQTVWHHPKPHRFCGYTIRSTLQLGSGPALATLLNIPVISDFRAADLALHGQGAPLVPICDAAYLRHPTESIITLNIGGIANLCFLPPRSLSEHTVIAFDSGPGNILIDAAANHFFQQPYDSQGQLAAQGTIHRPLLERLQQHPFFAQAPPKSTGREAFHWQWVQSILDTLPSTPSPHDILATLTFLTAWHISDHIQRFSPPDAKQILVSGGGIHNQTLWNWLQQLLPHHQLYSSATKGIDPDAKEAICFAYLAYRTWHHLSGNLPSVTGATLPTILGSIALPPRFALL